MEAGRLCKSNFTPELGIMVRRSFYILCVLWSLPAIGFGTEPLVTFYAIGDSPYSILEVPLLGAQVSALPDDARFLVHVGDIKLGSEPCKETAYERVAALLKRCKQPVFIVLGDNEWNDCEQPDVARKLWDKYFLRFESHWNVPFEVIRSKERPDNFAFRCGSVLFVGLTVVGGRVHDVAEWRQRHAANIDWLAEQLLDAPPPSHCVVIGHAALGDAHKDFTQGLRRLARQFGKPMLYLHGDGHSWIFDRPFGVDNLWRIQLDRAGLTPPVQIRVHADARQPFQFDRRLRTPSAN